MKKTLLSLFLLFLFTHSYAQVFPIQGSLQVIPPYTPYLTDYTAIGEQKLILQLRPNDNTLGDHPVRLRLSIEGLGITIRTKANYIPPSPHTLMGGGTPTILYSADLSNYFNPDNLDFAGFSRSDFQRSGKLPEGMYQFSFEVLDYYRQVALSSKIMTVVWIVLNDPPMLNLPFNNTKVTLIEPTNIAFNWTPRHTASPNSAFSTEYVFRLVEVWSVSGNAYDAFLSQPVLFEKTLTESQLIYGPSEPALSPGHTYAWQIQARDEEKKDVFKNQGKSEVFVFQFGDLLGVPENLRIAASSDRALNLEWEPAARGETAEQYNIQYKAVSAERWKETLTEKQWVILEGLQPNTDYQAQVRGKLKDVYSDYTPLLRAKTNEKAPDPPCGEPPPVIVPVTDKTSRLPQLNPGDVITCDDWRIVVLEATRSANGEYAGLGMMAVNMFNGASIEVKFWGAINMSYQMVTGGFESTYTKGSEIGTVAEEMKKIGEKKKSAAPIDTTTSTPITVPGIIDSVYFDQEKKEVVVVDKEGKKTTYPQKTNPKTKEAKPMQITDAAGNTVTVGKDGTVTKGAKAGGAGETSGNTIASIDPQINILIKEILASFSKDIDDYLARKPPIKKGPSADLYDEYFEKPDCLPDDADALHKIRTYSNKLQKNTKQMEQFVEGILQKEENRTYFNNLLKNSLDGYKQKKTYKETLSTEDYNKVCETICPYLVEGAEKYISIEEPKVRCVAANANLGKVFVAPDGSNIRLRNNETPLAFFAEEEGVLHGRLAAIQKADKIYIYFFNEDNKQYSGYWGDIELGEQKDASKLTPLAASNKTGVLITTQANASCPAALKDRESTKPVGNKQGTPDPAVTDYSGVLSAGQLENLQKLLSGKSPAEGGYHTSKLRLFITKKGDPEATAQSDEINNYQPAEGEICTWVELEEWKPKIKMVKYGSPKQESDFAKLLHDLGLTTESFWRDFPADWGTSVLNNFSIGLYTLMDWISHGIGKAAIPEYVWNCHVKTGYQDIYARTFNFLLDPFSLTPSADYVVIPFMNQYGSQFGKDLQYARFAYTCGLWNGLVQTVQSIPEGIKLLTNMGTKEPVKEWAAIKTEVAKACGNPNGNMCFVGFLKVAWNGISSMHDITKPCLFGYAMGNDVFLIISIYFTGGTGAVVSTSGRVLSTFLNVLNKLDVMGQIIGRATGATIKVVMMSGGKYAVSIVTKAGIEIFKVVEEKGVKSIYYVKAGVQTLIDWNHAASYKLITSNGVQYKVCVGELLNNNLEKANLRIKQYLKDADGNLIKNEQGDALAIVGKEGSEAEADNAVAVVREGAGEAGMGKAGLLAKTGSNYPQIKILIAQLDDVADIAFINKLDNFLSKATPNSLKKFDNLLNTPKLKQQAWDNVEGVFDTFKRVEDKSMAGVSLGHKNFPLVYDEGNTTFIFKNAKQYQAEASGDAALSFEKGGISWDNLDEAGKLVDRKYGHGSSVFSEVDDGFGGNKISIKNEVRARKIITQATRQANAAGDTPIRWEISTDLGARGIRELFDLPENSLLKNIEVVHVPQVNIIP